MKPIYQRLEDHSAAHQSPAMTVQLLRQDEAHQEQMRRLHNERARQRAARRPHAARSPM